VRWVSPQVTAILSAPTVVALRRGLSNVVIGRIPPLDGRAC
jgi:hypothetical protein